MNLTPSLATSHRTHILIVDDEREIRNVLKEILEEEGYEVSMAENGTAAQEARRARRPDAVLLDIWMPDIDGVSLLKRWVEEGSLNCPVIMMSGHGTVETAVEATRLGAYDFLEKPLSMAKLLLTVKRAIETDRLRRENTGLRQHTPSLAEPLGHSLVMQRLREHIQRAAQHEASVLLTGEIGSGKQVCARYLHSLSPRQAGQFIEVSVAALTRESAARELFGYEDQGLIRYGQLEQANGGSLFIDEIAELDLAIQGRLYSTLATGAFTRVGGATPVKLNARIIAASCHDLNAEIIAKRFREDLYYQLNVLPIRVPALREHAEDIPELLHYYVSFFVTHENLAPRQFTSAAKNRLRHYHWPGNIHELKNLVQRLLILGSGHDIDLEEIEPMLTTTPYIAEASSDFDLPLREAREKFERAYLEHQLRIHGGRIGRVAQLSGLERTHLYRKLRALGLNLKEAKAQDDE